MARRTDLELLVHAIKTMPSEQASRQRLAGLLGWEPDKVHRVAAKANDDPAIPLFIGKGGVIKHRGSERGASVGIYADVRRIITSYWGPREMGLRNITCIDTSRSGTRSGAIWTHPDLIISADPRRRSSSTELPRLHAVEVETAAGFDIRSVYQAHAQGRDANYSWVFGSKEPNVDKADWDRVLWTAQELGVGLVTFTKPHAFGTYVLHVPAEHTETNAEQREGFLSRTVSASARLECGL